VLAFLFDERGADAVEPFLANAAISAVNLSEVLKAIYWRATDADTTGLAEDFAALGIEIVHFDSEQAEAAAGLYGQTRHLGLSLADRACLAMAIRSGRPVVTADHKWRKLELEIEIHLFREPAS
jgi:ribonuclease VapC